MNRLSLEKRALIVGMLVEGNSIRATSRLSEVAFNTVLKFVADIGRACTVYQDRTLRTSRRRPLGVSNLHSTVYQDPKGVSSWSATSFSAA